MRLAAAFAHVGRIVGDGDEAALGHRLGIEARRLLLHRAVRAANHECGMPPSSDRCSWEHRGRRPA